MGFKLVKTIFSTYFNAEVILDPTCSFEMLFSFIIVKNCLNMMENTF